MAEGIYDVLFDGSADSEQASQAMSQLLKYKKGMALVGSMAGGPMANAAMMEKQGEAEDKNLWQGLDKRLQYGQERQMHTDRLLQQKQQFDAQQGEARRSLALTLAAMKGVGNKPADQSMDDPTLEMLAHQYARTGQLPPLGMGQAAVGHRMAIFKKASQLYPGLDVAGQMASFGADKGSLTGVTKMSDAVEAFERTAGKNLNLLLDTMAKIPDTGSPLFNKPIRAIDERLLGSNEMAAYRAARQVALTEISRVVSNPNLVGQLSDQARREVFEFNPDTATMAQTVAVAKILRQDMNNRIASLHEQRGIIKDRISTRPGQQDATQKSAAPSAVPPVAGPERGTSKSGKPMVKVNGQWVYE
jgi:hypothetical protein